MVTVFTLAPFPGARRRRLASVAVCFPQATGTERCHERNYAGNDPSIRSRNLGARARRRERSWLRHLDAEERAAVCLAVVRCAREDGEPAAERGLQRRLRRLQLQRLWQGPSSRRGSAGLACERALHEQLVEHAPLLRNRGRRGREDAGLSRRGVAGLAKRPSAPRRGRLLVLGREARHLPNRLPCPRPRAGGDVGRLQGGPRSTSGRRSAAPFALM
jgi:hypothetical protein